MPTLALPTTAGPAGDAARRLATWLGTGIAAKDGSVAAALLLGLGGELAETFARLDRALLEVIGATAVETLPEWEHSLGLPPGEGASVAERQAAITARWRSINGGPSTLDLLRALRVIAPEVVIVEVLVDDVAHSDPEAVFRLAVLVSDASEASAPLRARLAALLAPQAQGHVAWAIGRGAGPDIDAFRCDAPDSLVERDLLAI